MHLILQLTLQIALISKYLPCLVILQVEEVEDDDSSAFDELGRLGEQMEFLSPTNTEAKQSVEKTTGLKDARKKCKQVKHIQYTTRGKRHCYCEAEVPDDDHYICKSTSEGVE